jgi:UDP-sugar pyrophosphorylase
MQDYPKMLENCERVGYTSIDKGFCFTTVKNDLKTAMAKLKEGLSPESAGSCEGEFYQSNREMLRLCGAQVEEAPK